MGYEMVCYGMEDKSASFPMQSGVFWGWMIPMKIPRNASHGELVIRGSGYRDTLCSTLEVVGFENKIMAFQNEMLDFSRPFDKCRL